MEETGPRLGGDGGVVRPLIDAAEPVEALALPDAEIDSVPPPHATPVRGRAGLIVLGAALVIVSLNLRGAVTSLGPVLREAARATALSPALVSLLATLPCLCFGVFGPVAPWLGRRLGTERALLAVVAALALGIALRGLPIAPALFGGSLVAYGAIGVMNVLLPGLVKRDFPHHAAIMTGLYSTALCGGAAVAAGATVPLSGAFGSWAAALAFWALPAALAAALWATQVPWRAAGVARVGFSVRGLWSDRLAWQVSLFFGLQSALAYIVFAWLPPMLRDRGLTPAAAGFVLSLSVLAQAAASLVAPSLAVRGRDQRAVNAACMGLGLVGLLGCFYAPLPGLWLWAVLLGVSQGALIAVALTLIVLRSRDAHVAAHLSSMAQTVGYLVAAAGPFVAGLLHGGLGGWDAVAAFSVALGLLGAGFGWGAGAARVVGARTVGVAGR